MKNSTLYKEYAQLQCKLTNVILVLKKNVLQISLQRNFYVNGL